jgi:uncharacterized protein (DUF2384 family)
MPYELPNSLTPDDSTEVNRLLGLVFKGNEGEAKEWLTQRSDFFNCPPIDLLKRDELGVVRIISYLKEVPLCA